MGLRKHIRKLLECENWENQETETEKMFAQTLKLKIESNQHNGEKRLNIAKNEAK